MAKKIKEGDITTDIDTYKKNKYDIDSQMDDEQDTLNLTSSNTNEGSIDEVLKLPMSDVISSLGINLHGKTPEQRQSILTFIRQMMGDLQSKFGVGPLLGESDDKEDFQDPDLFGDEERAEREMDESFDDLMESLNKKGGPIVDVTKSVNPRIKKSDLIEYYKNKK